MNDNGEARQWVVPMGQWTVPMCEVHTHLRARALLDDEVLTAIDIEISPMRLLVVHHGTSSHAIVLLVHHISTDGTSTSAFIDTMTRVYNTILSCPNIPKAQEPQFSALSLLDADAVQYVDYAVWQREYLTNPASLQPHVAYWEALIGDGLPVLELQADHPRVRSLASTNGKCVSTLLSQEQTARLLAVCQTCSTTLMRGILTIWGLLLGKHSEQSQVIVGFPYANRDDPSLLNVTGYFINTLAVVVGQSGNFGDAVKRTGLAIGAAMRHADLPFMKLREIMQRASLYQTMLTWVEGDWGGTEATLFGLAAADNWYSDRLALTAARFEIELLLKDCTDSDGGLAGYMVYSTDLFTLHTVQQINSRLVTFVERLLGFPGLPLLQVGVLTSHERHLMVELWNSTAVPYASDRATAHGLFEQASARGPMCSALLFEGAVVSYSELETCTTQLAAHLVRIGVLADSVVGMCCEKSVEEVAGIVGIMRAAGA